MGSGNDILEVYLYEMKTLLEQLDEIVLAAERVGGFSEDDVNEIFRIMHTIKGSSAMMDFHSLMTVAHRIEDLFFVIREKSMSAVPDIARDELFDMIFHSIDFFRQQIGLIENNESPDQSIDSFLLNINRLQHKIQPGSVELMPEAPPEEEIPAPLDAPLPDAEPAPPIPAAVLPVAQDGAFPHQLHVFFDDDSGMENLRAFMLVTAIRELFEDSVFSFSPEDVDVNPATSEMIVEHGFLLHFKNPADREKAIPVVMAAGSVRTYQIVDPPEEEKAERKPAPGDTTDLGRSGKPPAQNQSRGPQPKQSHVKENLISVNLSKLDQLMAVVGEIVITESMVTSSPDIKGLKLDSFTQAARQLRTLTDELQDVSMSLRMVPVSSIFQKMNRVVRDIGKKLGKQVSLTIIGEETEVDKTIVDTIGDPIMHIVRNSMDHGLEGSAEERIKAGKDPVGEIILSAHHTGSEVIIEIIDDGKGVNYDAVLSKAIRQGLALPDTDYSPKEILSFLMMPGFSTNAAVTEFSGRGVGMDVVKSNIESVGGTVAIQSEPGKGMTTTLKIPLTMAIMDGMEVAVGSSIFTIPIANIRQIFKVSDRDVVRDASHAEMIKCMDQFYALIRAKDFYRLDGGYDTIDDGIVLWVESLEHTYCLFVDELIGEQQVVVKPLPGYVNHFGIKHHGISGCTILGDGNISLILDISNIYAARYLN